MSALDIISCICGVLAVVMMYFAFRYGKAEQDKYVRIMEMWLKQIKEEHDKRMAAFAKIRNDLNRQPIQDLADLVKECEGEKVE